MKVKGIWKKFYRIGFLIKINIRLDAYSSNICWLQTPNSIWHKTKKKKKEKLPMARVGCYLMFLSAYSAIFCCKSIEEDSDANEAY